MIRTGFYFVILGLLLNAPSSYGGRGERPYPIGPDASLTPGALCNKPDTYRYPEKIPYCERDVESSTKREIIQTYDKELGYRVGAMNRQDFKIDHLVPLCMGGANGKDNLWPQHKTVYVITDPFEEKLCKLMAEGQLKQIKALEMIRKLKDDLDQADGIMSEIARQQSRNGTYTRPKKWKHLLQAN